MNKQEKDFTDLELVYLIKGAELELQKAYIDSEILDRNIKMMEQELIILRQNLLNMQKESLSEPKYRKYIKKDG